MVHKHHYRSENDARSRPQSADKFNLQSKLRGLWPLLLLGFIQLVIYALIISLVDLGRNISVYVSLFLLCFVFYVCSILFVKKLPSRQPLESKSILLILLFAVAFRLIMLPLKPSLSHDMMRFLWDGRLLSHGVNPYLYRPDSAQLDAFKNVPFFSDYEFKNTFTIYPPLAQLLFAGSYVLYGDNPLGIKAEVVAIDLLSILVLSILLHKSEVDSRLASLTLYAWSPLLVVETAGNGHIEPLPIFFLLLSLILLSNQRYRLSSVAYSFACWSKLFPILLLPLYLKYVKSSGKRNLREFASFYVLSSLLILLPVFSSSGINLLYQVFWYSQNITYNSSISIVVRALLATAGIGGVPARLSTYIIFLLAFTVILRLKRLRSLPDMAEGGILVLGVFLLVAPTVLQWYILWLLPFVALKGLNRDSVGWLYFSGAVVLAYLPQFSLDYDLNTILLLEYLPLYLILGFLVFFATKSFSRPFRHWFVTGLCSEAKR